MFSFTASLILAASGTLAGSSDVDQAVEREFRLYRIQVYNTYRTWRSEYDRRRVAGEAAYHAWQRAGQQPLQANQLVAWFRGAKMASLAHVNRPLPALPQFPAAPPQAIVAAPQTPAKLPPRRTTRRPVERFDVRRLEEGQSQRTVALAAHSKQRPLRDEKVSPRSSWKSVSAALYKGMVFGATRVMPK
jgi:hypothetical protein